MNDELLEQLRQDEARRLENYLVAGLGSRDEAVLAMINTLTRMGVVIIYKDDLAARREVSHTADAILP